uniref:Uncharacterized protein n=1 Tax=Arundo donax TaxID=35708 RepID=A0A0A9ES02_ARUDO
MDYEVGSDGLGVDGRGGLRRPFSPSFFVVAFRM